MTVIVPTRHPVLVPTRHPVLVLAAHGSADPRSAAVTHAVAGWIRRLRPRLEVRPAFLGQTSPSLRETLRGLDEGVVVPFLLADAYHARVDIPAMISGLPVRQARVLGEDPRLVRVLHERLTQIGVSRFDEGLGVVVVAVGSSHREANQQTSTVAAALAHGTRWAGTATAFATGPHRTVAQAAEQLRDRGASRLVIAPWFLAPGRITDRVAAHGISMAQPLGPHPLVAETVLDRFDEAIARRAAA